MTYSDGLYDLHAADPEFARSVAEKIKSPLSKEQADILSGEAVWALSEDRAFGSALADGYVDLFGRAGREKIEIYRKIVRKSGETGPTLGRIMAKHLVPVLLHGDELLLEIFLGAVHSIIKKGMYALEEPLEAASFLLGKGEIEACRVYLVILEHFFLKDLTYGESRHFSHFLPKSVLSFPPLKRTWQLKELYRIILEDHLLAGPFAEGMDKGLSFLSQEALKDFVSLGLDRIGKDKKSGIKFLSLESKSGTDAFINLKTSAPLSDVRQSLIRYGRAKTGVRFSICSVSRMPGIMKSDTLKEFGGGPFVFSDAKTIYLPDEINLFDDYDRNRELYKNLVRLESGYHEFGSYEFDIEKALLYCRRFGHEPAGNTDSEKECSDLDRFTGLFSVKELAADLFDIFEQGRLRIITHEKYPGLLRITNPILLQEVLRIREKENPEQLFFFLFLKIALGEELSESSAASEEAAVLAGSISALFEKRISDYRGIETCALLLFETCKNVESLLNKMSPNGRFCDKYRRYKTPFGRRLRPDLYYISNKKHEETGKRIRAELEHKGFQVFKSEIVKILSVNNGDISNDDIVKIMISSRDFQNPLKNEKEKSSGFFLPDLINPLHDMPPESLFDDAGTDMFKYREWSTDLDDYLNDHVVVRERNIEGFRSDFYSDTLMRYRGAVKRIRREFELLRPEDMLILRRWVEGDELDYLALIDFILDKKAGMIPSDRFYIKKIKQKRDIATLLLLDLSRSTSSLVMESNKTVHEIIKEAAVLFCEALGVAGDKFAVAGFSGTGRFGVDYYKIKDFSEIMDEKIINRINAVSPQRRTRMGAAIRHATAKLENMNSRTKLLLIISDGFPNDTGYRQNYAVGDTRMAVMEAQSKKICVRAITVDAASDERLDDLYGHFNHNVISDIRELPGRLLKIYGNMTRQ
jgi:hypothetical protein